MRIIEIVVSPQGETTVQTKGYSGGDCLAASKPFEQALGIVSDERKTVEFFHQEAVAQQELRQ
jgi:hypothetical protein